MKDWVTFSGQNVHIWGRQGEENVKSDVKFRNLEPMTKKQGHQKFRRLKR